MCVIKLTVITYIGPVSRHGSRQGHTDPDNGRKKFRTNRLHPTFFFSYTTVFVYKYIGENERMHSVDELIADSGPPTTRVSRVAYENSHS